MVTKLSKPKIKIHVPPKHFRPSSKCKRQLRKSNLVIGKLKFPGFNSFFFLKADTISKTRLSKFLAGFTTLDIEQIAQVPKLVTLCLPSSWKLGYGRWPQENLSWYWASILMRNLAQVYEQFLHLLFAKGLPKERKTNERNRKQHQSP